MVHSHVTSAFEFFFDLFSPILQNVNINREHHHLLLQNPFLNFDANSVVTCEQGLNGAPWCEIAFTFLLLYIHQQ